MSRVTVYFEGDPSIIDKVKSWFNPLHNLKYFVDRKIYIKKKPRSCELYSVSSVDGSINRHGKGNFGVFIPKKHIPFTAISDREAVEKASDIIQTLQIIKL